MTSRKLRNHPYCKCEILTDREGNMALRSYNTVVIVIDSEGWMCCRGLCSATTRRQISWFMRELGLDYSVARNCYNREEEYNIMTGEIRSLQGFGPLSKIRC